MKITSRQESRLESRVTEVFVNVGVQFGMILSTRPTSQIRTLAAPF